MFNLLKILTFFLYRITIFISFNIADSSKIDLSSLEAADSPFECLALLFEPLVLSRFDVVFLQFLLKTLHCEELYSKCWEFASRQHTLCFRESLSGIRIHLSSLFSFSFNRDILLFQKGSSNVLKNYYEISRQVHIGCFHLVDEFIIFLL